jgi:phosphoglycerate dehydrogenase-like enzyme
VAVSRLVSGTEEGVVGWASSWSMEVVVWTSSEGDWAEVDVGVVGEEVVSECLERSDCLDPSGR